MRAGGVRVGHLAAAVFAGEGLARGLPWAFSAYLSVYL